LKETRDFGEDATAVRINARVAVESLSLIDRLPQRSDHDHAESNACRHAWRRSRRMLDKPAYGAKESAMP
jgi:hypothetical protein